jgi:hypothetical protein
VDHCVRKLLQDQRFQGGFGAEVEGPGLGDAGDDGGAGTAEEAALPCQPLALASM